MSDSPNPLAAPLGAPPHEPLPAEGDPFAGIDPQAGEGPDPNDPFKDAPILSRHTSTGLGAFTAHAFRGALPTAAGMVAAGAGAEAGGAAGALIGSVAGPPGAAAGGLVGGLVGGLGGFFLGSTAADRVQDWGVSQLPMSLQEATGQSERARREQEIQHPYYSFLGGIAPYALTMSPGGLATKALNLPEGATTFQRIMANPLTSRVFGGVAMGGMELGQELLGGQSPDWTKVAVSTGFGLVFNHPTRFGEYLTDLGAHPLRDALRPTPVAEATAPEPTVIDAADLGVMGPGVTESTFHGTQEQSAETRITAQNAAADEQAVIGPPAEPDLSGIARRLDPETFRRNDELVAQRDSLRQFIDEQSNPPDAALDDLALKRAETEMALRYANQNGPDARNLRAALRDLDAQREDMLGRRAAWDAGRHVDTPDVMLARQHLIDTEHALWDLGPQISAAMRRAADHVGQEPPAAAEMANELAPAAPPPASALTQPAGAEAAPPPAPATKSPEAQQAFIASDRAAQLMAAGMPRARAEASAHVEAAYYATLAQRFGGALGTAEDLYRARAARIAGAGPVGDAPPPPITRTEPTPVRIRTVAEIQKQDQVSVRKARATQEQEIEALAKRPAAPVAAAIVAPQAPESESTATFRTAKGSEYVVHPDGTTSRDKAFRPEHGEAEQGPQLRSEATFYVTPEQASLLGEIQATGLHARAISTLPDGRVGIRYLSGPQAGKWESRTVITPQFQPTAGLLPVETWQGGKRVHFGNPITEVRGASLPEPVSPTPAPESPSAAPAPAAPEPAIPAQPPARPRLRTAEQIMREDRVSASRVKAIQEQEIIALAGWQAEQRAAEPAARRNPEIDGLAANAGVQTDGVAPAQVLAEIVATLPPERVIEEVHAAAETGTIEYREAEREAESVAPEVRTDPDAFYDADQSRSLEELEREHRPADETAVAQQRHGGGGEPEAAAGSPEPLPEGGGSPRPVAESGERAGPEIATAGGAGESATMVAERPAAEPGAAARERASEATRVAGRPNDARGNPIFAKGERVVIPDGQPLAGRHGTVEEAIGIRWKPAFGGEASEAAYHYTIRTDGGVQVLSSRLEPEVGERPTAVPDPVYDGRATDPDSLSRSIGHDEASARKATDAERRARTPTSRAAHREAARTARGAAAAKRDVLDQWVAAHPEEAERALPQRGGPATETAATAEPAAPAARAGMSIVETRHTKSGKPLWVVTGGPRVERAEYDRMLAEAKQNGGYWSSFRGRGAVPGWTFDTQAGAEAFLRGAETAPAAAPTPIHDRSVAIEMTAPSAPGWREVGKNRFGETLYEDARGVHSIVRDGVRQTEAVGLRPSRSGMQIEVPSDAARGDRWKVAAGEETAPPTVAEVAEQAGKGRLASEAPPLPAPPVADPGQAPPPPSSEGAHFSAGWSARQRGEPRDLPGYFTGEAHNSRDWFRGWDAAGNTPEARIIADAVAPAEGKGPLPVTSAPPPSAEAAGAKRITDLVSSISRRGRADEALRAFYEIRALRAGLQVDEFAAQHGMSAEDHAAERQHRLLGRGEPNEARAAEYDRIAGLLDAHGAETAQAERAIIARHGATETDLRSIEDRLGRIPERDAAAADEALEARYGPAAIPPIREGASPPPSTSPEYGANNKLVTRADAEAIRARLRAKAAQLRTGIDPEMMLDGARLAVFHIEAGARAFGDYSREMIQDIGEGVRPYLRSWYEAARHWPGMDARGMTLAGEVEDVAPAPQRQPETPEDRADIDRLLDAHRNDPIIHEIARLTGAGWTPEEIEAGTPGDRYSLDEIESIVRAQDRRGEIPEPTEAEDQPELPLAEEGEHGIQGTVPASDEGGGPEGVHGTSPGGEVGSVRPGSEPGGAQDAARPVGEKAEERARESEPGGRTGGRGDSVGALPRLPDAGEGAEPGAARRPAAQRPDAQVTGENFTIEPGAVQEARGRLTKARDNVAAIELAARLAAESRPATKAEQATLVKYVGWGGLKDAFPDSQGNFGRGMEAIGARLREILTPQEYATAQRSVQYAHYTAEHVIRSMWEAVRRMGFNGGLVFEPGMGIGHFLGMMPPDLAQRVHYQGIEMDHLTASIAKLLYPESGVRQGDLTRIPLPEQTFDLVIGNPPFSDTIIKADPKYAARGFMLHDYFFAKSLDAVRPGGLLAFVTSAGTMNKLDAAAREYLAERGEFLGGIRLPSSAFRRNAGTDVTTDILFFKRHPEGRVAAEGVRPEWTETVTRALPNAEGATTEGNVSRYFADHPEMVLGEEGFFDKLYKDRYAVHQIPGSDLTADLRAAIERLPEDVMVAPPSIEQRAELDFASGQKKDGSFYIADDGRLMQYRGGAGREVVRRGKGAAGGFTAAERERVEHLVPLRDALRDVFAADLAEDVAAGDAARARMNEHYDRFVEKFGPINKAEFSYRRPTLNQQENARLEAREEARFVGDFWDDGDFDPSAMLTAKARVSEIAKARQEARERTQAEGRPFREGSFDPDDMPDVVHERRPNIKPFMADPESYRLRSIERYDESAGEGSKKEIFFTSILKREREPEIRSANDGVLWSMNKYGQFDLDRIAERMGRDRADIVAELGDAVYKVPGTRDTYQTRDEYLSGDVVAKLEEARAAAETDPDVRRNIPALEAAVPPPLPPSEISMVLGMPWIPIATVREFVRDHLKLGDPGIVHSAITGTWHVDGKGWGHASGVPQWGAEGRDAFELLSDMMNRTPPRIYDTVHEDGKTTRVFNAVSTQAAQDKVDAIKAAFSEWALGDAQRADSLAQIYNDRLNRSVLRQYDGSYLTTPGVAATWQWRPHQTRVVARIVQSGNTYMAHAVGAGKTSAMIGSAMEMRRLGLVRKPLFVVPNHMLGQFTKEFYEQYPTARIAVADEDRFHTDRRRQFVANVAQDDLDAIIMPHSSFGKIPISDGFQEHLVREQIEALEQAISQLSGPENRIVRGRIEKQKEKLEQRLSARDATQDQTLTFEELGADFLFVDEAHQFRKLSFGTKQAGMKGISPEGSNMAWDLYTKVRYLDGQKPGRSVVFASGTPITNTMGELYSLSRFMQPETLKKLGLSHFDSWAQTFGDTKTGLEETAAGTYQPVTRFGQFVNLPELYKMVGEIMDSVTPSQLEQYVTRPKLTAGQRQFHLAPRTEILDAYQAELAGRMRAIKDRRGPPQKGDDILLSVINDGRHSAIDPRFVAETQNDPHSKLNVMISNVARIWRETADHQFYDPASGYTEPSFRGPATQMIFANLGVNGRGPMGFSSYQWMKEALRREGIPAEQIAFIGDYKSTIARQALFNDMNEGKVRILIGSTQKMGTGVNAQRRLYAMHNQDPLWYPADDEQRVGRILRQGNHNREIEVHDYSTKGTYDSAMWKMMGNKARFIEQFFRGDPELRNMEDVGEASMYEQASAMATTDERIITLTQMKQDLDRARRRDSAHHQEQYSLRQQLKSKEREADRQAEIAKSIREDIERREDTRGDKFSMLVGGQKFDKRPGAAEALDAEIQDRAAGLGKAAEAAVGRIGGFPLIMRRDAAGDLLFSLRASGGAGLTLNATRGAGLIASAESVLRGFENNLTYAERQRAAVLQAAENIHPLLGRPFTGQPEIDRLSLAVRDLEGQLRAEAKAAEKGSASAAAPAEDNTLYQRFRHVVQGKIRMEPGDARSVITLARTADASTFMHETAHDWLKQLLQDALHHLAPPQLRADAATVRKWLGRPESWTGFKPDGSPDVRPHERFARGFEQYLREGVAPSPRLARVFDQFRTWLTTIYRTLRGLGAPINDDIRGVFDRMLAIKPQRTVYAGERQPAPGIGAVHKTDAVLTEPHEAESVADRVVSERDRYTATQPPEVADEIAAAGPGDAAEPGGEAGEGEGRRGALDGNSGQPKPLAPGGGRGTERGDVEPGGGQPLREGAGVPGGTERPAAPERQRGAGETAGPGHLAPSPADSFTDTGSDRLTDLAGNIRVENLTDIDSIAQAIHDSAERNGEFHAVRGGMTKGQMLDLAEAMGLEPDKIDETGLARLLGGTQNLGPRVLAARQLVVRSAAIVSDMMKRSAESGVDRDAAALGVAIARHDLIQSALAGVTAEWGRAGNAFHSLLEGWERAKDVNKLLRDNLGRDLFQLKMIAKLGARLDSPGKVSKLLRDGQKRTFGRMVLEYWVNGLISGPSTHVTYMVGNALLAAEKAGPETAVAAAIGGIRERFGRSGERVRLGEVGAQLRAAFREAPAAAQATLEAYRSGLTTLLPGETARPLMPFQGDTTLTVGRNMTNAPVTWGEVRGDAYALVQGMRDGLVAAGELVKSGGVAGAPLWGAHYSPLGQIPDLAYRGVSVLPLGTLARLPGRNVAAIHSAFRTMNYSMEINALAYRRAAEEGLTGAALAARTAELRQNPAEEMMEQARGRATELTLMSQGGAFVQALQRLTNVEVMGFPPLKFVDPFVAIAANILNQTLAQRTPIGLLSAEIRADLLGRNGNVAQDTTAAKMLVGTAVAIAFGGLAAQGLMSGSGPADPRKAAMWRLAGNQAHSIRIGDVWYDMHRLGPMGLLASVAADMYDVSHMIGTEEADVVGKALMHAITQNILDESFMRGPSDLIKAVTDPDRYGAGYVRTFLSSFVPYSVGMAQAARAMDPYSRQARTIMDAVKAKVPGLSESLFPRRDIWGEPMPSGDALIAPGITAIYARQVGTDPVNRAMLDLGIAPAPVQRDIRNVPLSDQQYDDFARVAGRSTKLRLDAIVRSPDWQSWPPATRHEVIEETIRQSREAARGLMMMKYPEIPRMAARALIARRTGASTPIHAQ